MAEQTHVMKRVEKVRGRDLQGKVHVLDKTQPQQLVLFQTFLPEDDPDEKFSNTIEFYDAIRPQTNTRVTSRQLVCPKNAPLEQSELLRFRAPPADVRGWSSLRGAVCRSAPGAGVERSVDVEPRQHSQQEGPRRTHMGIDQWRQRPAIRQSQPGDPSGLAEHPLEPQGVDIDQSVLEQVQG